jgi:threonine synthase
MTNLRCQRCGRAQAIGLYPTGCPACFGKGHFGLLEVAYDHGEATRRHLEEILAEEVLTRPGRRSLWRFSALLPAPADAAPVTLGEGDTPLIEAHWLGEPYGLTVYLKNETANPTWCAKDRVNAVSVTVASALGARGVVATTTGNHGASMVAYAARTGLPAIAICSPQSDIIHRAMIAAYGGTAIVSYEGDKVLGHLVHECGWFASTSMGNTVAPNPYGVEGCKTIAYELLETLPDVVLVPAASGDLLYGVHKGFRELNALGLADRTPRMIACQAQGAAPLAATGTGETVPVLANPATVAISIGDPTSGQHALTALRETSGSVVTVSDQEILEAQADLARHGLLVEPASAASVAALAAAYRQGALARGERAVCLLTGAAVKWSSQLLSTALGSSAAGGVLLEPSLASVTELAGQLTVR